MGLIPEVDIPNSSGTPVEVTLPLHAGVVVEEIPLHTQSVVATDGSSSSFMEKDVVMDSTHYRRFSSQDDMKTWAMPSRVRNEFELFMDYAVKLTSGEITEVNHADNYLGSLGV